MRNLSLFNIIYPEKMNKQIWKPKILFIFLRVIIPRCF